jgi:hypothetical protein
VKQVGIDLDGNFAPNTAAMPYRVWVNDSKKSGDIASGAGDQIPGQTYFNANYSSLHVNGRSDLVNFFPVALCPSNTLALLPPTNGWEYRLVQSDAGFQAMVAAQLDNRRAGLPLLKDGELLLNGNAAPATACC